MTIRACIYAFAIFFVFAALALTACRAYAADAPTPPVSGTPAPDFKLTSQEGKSVSLHDFRGQWVVLYFYPKDFTSGCTIEAHNFQTDLGQYLAKHAVILGVSVDTAASHKSFCTKENLHFKLLADTDHTVSAAYGSLKSFGPLAISARNTFIIDPSGTIVKRFIGVQPAQHSQEVLTALTELQKRAGK